METTQGNTLCSYLYLKLVKMPCFPYYLLYFFLLQNWRPRGKNRFCPKREEWVVQIINTDVIKCKHDKKKKERKRSTRGEMMKNNGGVNLIEIYCKHICKSHNVYPVQLLNANKNVFKKEN
jgi:hypothetical protein